MLSIRLQRVGRSKQAYFRLILQEKTANPKSKNLELLGSYDPRTKVYVLKEDRIKYWLSVGAEATNTVFNMLVDKGILTGAKKKTASIVKPEVVAEEKHANETPIIADVSDNPNSPDTTKPEETPAPAVEAAPAEVKEEKPAEITAETAPVAAEVAAEKPAEVVPTSEAVPTETAPAETPAA